MISRTTTLLDKKTILFKSQYWLKLLLFTAFFFTWLDYELLEASILAYEPFDISTGTSHGRTGASAFGWFYFINYWQNQNSYTGSDGYVVSSSSMLSHSGIPTSGNYLHGGHNYETMGRYLNMLPGGAFDAHRDGSSRIGSGTIYLSFLVRKETNNNDPVDIILADHWGVGWGINTECIKIGYHGTSSNSGGNRYWTLSVDNESSIDLTDTVISTGTTYYLVTEIAFGATTNVKLWVNPPLDNLPSTPDASVSTTTNIGFWNMVFYANENNTNHGSLDEIRFSDNSSDLLPVDFYRIHAVKEGDDINLEWVTTSEIDNDYFIIQRSRNGIEWDDLKYINGSNKGIKTISYKYVDHNPPLGSIYYRIKQVDFNGDIGYSSVLTVENNEDDFEWTAYVDYKTQQIKIKTEKEVYFKSIGLRSINGNNLMRLNINDTQPSLPLKQLQTGIYFVLLESDEKRYTKRIFVKN